MAVGTAAHLPGDGNVVVATSSYVPMPAQPVAYDSSADAARAHKGVFGPYTYGWRSASSLKTSGSQP